MIENGHGSFYFTDQDGQPSVKTPSAVLDRPTVVAASRKYAVIRLAASDRI